MQSKFSEKPSQDILNDIYKQYHSQLLAHIVSAETLLTVKRIYDSGQSLELAFKNFFLSVLPNYVGITRGFVFDSNFEKHSNEIDLIFYDKRYFAGFPIYKQGDDALSYIPIDVVFGVAQVKATLNYKTLYDSIENLKTVLSLERKPLKNYLHHDINLNGSISFYDGQEVNRVFSCVLSGKNDMFFKNDKETKVAMSEQEIVNSFLEETAKKYNSLRKIPIDLLYTIDGVAFIPVRYNHEKSCAELFIDIFSLGVEKEFLCILRKIIPNMPILYGIKKNFVNPVKMIGIPISYISYWCSRLIKNSPNIEKFIDKTFPVNPRERWVYEKFFDLT